MPAEYQPTSRRPIAALFRRTAAAAVRGCVRAGIHPDAISYVSLVAAAGAGACFWRAAGHPWLLVAGPLLCFLRLWFNMLDGMVALASGTASLRGEILNDLPDRMSDVVIFAGVAQGGLCHAASGYWAAILALMAAYVGTLGQAVAGRREFAGVMSKPWRMVVLGVGAWATFAVIVSGRCLTLGRLTILDWTCLAIVAGCVQTICVRLGRTMRALRGRKDFQ